MVAPVHCYANVAQIGVLNLALMMPFGFVSGFPDTHAEMYFTDVSLLCTPITQSVSPRGGLLAAATAALAVTE